MSTVAWSSRLARPAHGVLGVDRALPSSSAITVDAEGVSPPRLLVGVRGLRRLSNQHDAGRANGGSIADLSEGPVLADRCADIGGLSHLEPIPYY